MIAESPYQQLNEFVAAARKSRVEFRTIRQDLLTRGWTSEQIEPVLTRVREVEQNLILLKAQSKNPDVLKSPQPRSRGRLTWAFGIAFAIALTLTFLALQSM